MKRLLLLAALPAVGCAGSPNRAPQGPLPPSAPSTSHVDTEVTGTSLDAGDGATGSDPRVAAAALAAKFGAITSMDASSPDPQVPVNPRLPPSVIQQVVRAHFASLRRCYEDGLTRNPNLAGMVSTKFIIARDGTVAEATLASTTLSDPIAAACVVHGYRALRFPAPEGGIVTVVYPVQFNPE